MLFTDWENLLILLWIHDISDSGASLATSINYISFNVIGRRKLVLFHGFIWKGLRQPFTCFSVSLWCPGNSKTPPRILKINQPPIILRPIRSHICTLGFPFHLLMVVHKIFSLCTLSDWPGRILLTLSISLGESVKAKYPSLLAEKVP